MRIMAIDYGDQRIGLAVSDALGILVGDAWTLKEWKMERAAKTIAQECKTRGVGLLVLGLPKNMDGSESFRAEKTYAFADMLKAELDMEIIFIDERLSTVEAYTYMNITDFNGKKRKKVIDALSAQIILQSYLDKNRK